MASESHWSSDERALTLSSVEDASPADGNGSAELNSLRAELRELRNNVATKEETEEIKREVKDLQQDVRLQEERRLGAESYATLMAMEREHVVRERDDAIQACQLENTVLKERHQHEVLLAVQDVEERRAQMEKDYKEKISQLQVTHSQVLQQWTKRIKLLEEENQRLKEENAYLRQTLFVVRRDPDYELSQNRPFRCYSCNRSYSTESNGSEDCGFHPLLSMAPAVWRRWEIGVADDRLPEYARHLYWPCCHTLSVSRPAGCCRGPHHQKWEMDVMMKRVMLSPDFLNETENRQEPKIQ